jgi:hypothetical protein
VTAAERKNIAPRFQTPPPPPQPPQTDHLGRRLVGGVPPASKKRLFYRRTTCASVKQQNEKTNPKPNPNLKLGDLLEMTSKTKTPKRTEAVQRVYEDPAGRPTTVPLIV